MLKQVQHDIGKVSIYSYSNRNSFSNNSLQKKIFFLRLLLHQLSSLGAGPDSLKRSTGMFCRKIIVLYPWWFWRTCTCVLHKDWVVDTPIRLAPIGGPPPGVPHFCAVLFLRRGHFGFGDEAFFWDEKGNAEWRPEGRKPGKRGTWKPCPLGCSECGGCLRCGGLRKNLKKMPRWRMGKEQVCTNRRCLCLTYSHKGQYLI